MNYANTENNIGDQLGYIYGRFRIVKVFESSDTLKYFSINATHIIIISMDIFEVLSFNSISVLLVLSKCFYSYGLLSNKLFQYNHIL